MKFRVTDRGNTGCVASTGEGAGMSKTLSDKQKSAIKRKVERRIVTIERKNIRKNIARNGGRF